MKKILSILLLLLCAVGCWAKDGKIKYGKCIRYEGEVSYNNPSGKGKLLIFDADNDKKILMTINGRFDWFTYKSIEDAYIIPISISDALVESFDTRWSYSAETTVELMIYPKLKKQKLSVTMSSPELQHPTQQIPKIISKSKINYIFNVNKSHIDYSSNSEFAKPMEVKIPEYDMVLQRNFSDISSWKESKSGSFEGTVMLHEDGSISDFSGDFLSEQAIYRIKASGINCFVNEILSKGTHFGLIDDRLFLDRFKIDNGQCKVSGELIESSIFLYKGEYSLPNTQFCGNFILTNRESTPLDFYRGISNSTIECKEGKLKKGSEEYEGSWNIKGAFRGKYVNHAQNLYLTECTISDTGIMEGEGFIVQQNSISILGHYSNGGFNGEGEVQCPRHSSIKGIFENSSLISGTTDIECEGETAHFDIVLRNGSYEYSHQGKVYGKARLEDLFGALVNASYAALNIENPDIDKAPSFVTAVDLGLPSGTLWSNVNIGATTPEGSGNYYAWGEKKTKAVYSHTNHITRLKDADGFETRKNLGDDISGTQYDVAAGSWGGTWCMPSETQVKELMDNCEWEWIKKNGVQGFKITGRNGNWIFLPAAGFKRENRHSPGNCNYWTSTHGYYESDAVAVYAYQDMYGNNILKFTRDGCFDGMPIRAVKN